MQLSETKIDISKIYFHGSSEARVAKLEAPSYEHPFYVTTDLHYAMAFCTKDSSSTGEWKGHSKKYTPYSQNFVYAVTLKTDCNVFDFRDKKSSEFKKFYDVIDKDIVDWVLDSNETYDRNDIYEFIVQLNVDVFGPLDEDKTYDEYCERHYTISGKPVHPEIRVMSKQLYNKCQKFIEKYGFQNAYRELDIHEIMAPLLKKLNQLGFQGICTSEHDINEEFLAKVTTEYAIGIFDVNGLDILSLVPMKYEWLKKVNQSYLEDKTSSTAYEKIKRFIQLYKRIAAKQNLQESSIDLRHIWYFGNNRSKNLKLAPPKWYSPFFLTTDYSYAEKYSDYGVYTITLKGEVKSKILDFNKDSDVKKLKWPRELIDDIRTGKSDLNGIAYDMYILAGYGHSQEVFDKSWHLSDAAYDFDMRSENIFGIVPKHASWASEKDHRFLLQMWKDIYDAGFDGFTHFEFGKKILALFDFKCMDKISIKPVKADVNEKLKRRALGESIQSKRPRSISRDKVR